MFIGMLIRHQAAQPPDCELAQAARRLVCKKCAEKVEDRSDRKRSLDAGALPLVNLSLTTNMTESYRAMTSKGTWVSSLLEGKESMRVRTFPSTTVGSPPLGLR